MAELLHISKLWNLSNLKNLFGTNRKSYEWA